MRANEAGSMAENTGKNESKNSLASLFSRREQKLVLVRDLCQSLEQSRTAILATDLKNIQLHTEKQQIICESLRELNACSLTAKPHATLQEILAITNPTDITNQTGHTYISAEDEQRWAGLTRQLQNCENEARCLAKLCAALLRRVRRTTDVWLRILMSAAPTYTPAMQPSLALVAPGHVRSSAGPVNLSSGERG